MGNSSWISFYIPVESMKIRAGFTLIELLLVVAIVSILGVSGSAIGQRFLVTNYLENKTNELASILITAQLNSMSGKENSQWGVSVSGNQMTLFKGDSFATRDSSFDMSFSIPNSISVTSDEVVFSRVVGEPDAVATYTLSSNSAAMLL